MSLTDAPACSPGAYADLVALLQRVPEAAGY